MSNSLASSVAWDPEALGARCSECPLKGCTPVAPDNNRGATIAVVVEAPGEQEERQGRQLLGPNGDEFGRALRGAGLKRGDTFITSVLSCRPPGNDLTNLLRKISKYNKGQDAVNHIPSPIDCCRPRLLAEVSKFENFITLGTAATRAITGHHASILAIRGGLQDLAADEDFGARKVMPSVSPGFVLKAQRWAHVFRNDIFKAALWFKGQVDWSPPETVLNPTAAELTAFLAQPDIIYAFDLETDGIEPLTAKIRCVGIGYESKVHVVSLLGKDGFTRFYSPEKEAEITAILKEFLSNPNKAKSSWNGGSYDYQVLRSQWGISCEGNIDGIMLHRLVESELPHSLAFVASLYTSAPAWKCYDAETEVLTPEGWVRYDKLEKGTAVAQWDNGAVSFVKPLAYVDQAYTGKMWRLLDQATDLLVTPDHKMIYRPRQSLKCKVVPVQDLPKSGCLPHAGVYATPEVDQTVSAAFIRLLAAFQADGSWAWRNKTDTIPAYLDFGFTKERKIERLKAILTELGITYSEKQTGTVNPRTRIWVGDCPAVRLLWPLLGVDKQLGSWLLGWSCEMRNVFLDELPLWDGTKGEEHTNYNTVDPVNADWVQICAVLTGRTARKYTYPNSSGYRPNHYVALPRGVHRSREWSRLDKTLKEQADYDGRVYCVSVPSGFLLVRRNGKVTVSGNTNREGLKLAVESETDEQLARYCSIDVSVTAAVIPKLAELVRLRNQATLWRMDQKIQRVCCDMHTVGMYVDQTVRLKEEKRLLALRFHTLKTLREQLEATGFKRDDFNPGSIYHIRDLLFGKWQLDPQVEDEDKFTASGDLSTGDLILRALLTSDGIREDYRDAIKLIRRYRKVMKVLGTYVVKLRPSNVKIDADLGWDEEEDWDDKETRKRYGIDRVGIVNPATNRMHPGWSAHIPVTGRLSSSKPINAMNFPKSMRKIITCQPGNVLVGADMDQLELRIAAARWHVELYLRAFAEGKDPHSMTAFAVFGEAFCTAAGIDPRLFSQPGRLVGVDYDNTGKFIGKGESKKYRDLSKQIQYASQYEATPETVHELVKKTEVEKPDGTTDLPYSKLPLRKVREMRENWLRGAPEFEAGWASEMELYRNQGFIAEPVTGRRRDFMDGENPNEISNFSIQSSAAGLMNRALLALHSEIPLHKWGPGTGITNQCHDSIMIECPADKAEWVKGLLEECLNQTHPDLPGVTFSASADIGHSWDKV